MKPVHSTHFALATLLALVVGTMPAYAQACNTQSYTDENGVFHSMDLGCRPNSSSQPQPQPARPNPAPQPTARPTLSVTQVLNPNSNKTDYTLHGSGMLASTEDKFEGLAIVLVNSAGDPVGAVRYVQVGDDGTLVYPLASALPAGDYAVAAFDTAHGDMVAGVVFTAADDPSIGGSTGDGVGAGYLPPWQTCTGAGAACPSANPYGPFTTP